MYVECTIHFSIWPSAGDWIVFGAELLVALVIYLELRHNREANFLQKAADFNANKSRRKMYRLYFKSVRDSGNLSAAPEAFNQLLRSSQQVRRCSENQLALFNELGLVYRKTFGIIPTSMVKVIPHATIFLWVFLKEHIKERRRLSGPWFATPFLRFALESVKYAQKFHVPLHLHAFEPFQEGVETANEQPNTASLSRDLIISPGDLKGFRKEIKEELKAGKRWYERPWL